MMETEKELNAAKEKAITKVYEKIAETGMVTQNQLYFLSLFMKRKNDPTELLIKEATKLMGIDDNKGDETK